MNAFLKKMGFSEDDKVLITHIDDMGFCHAANMASFECLDSGAASCGSVIVNAPWFLETAEICKQNPQYDVGVHLTLTCEYSTFRWPALSSKDPESGLVDAQGYLWHTREDAIRHVKEEAAEAEMREQIDRALEAGIDVTHIDTHMGSVVHPKFLRIYLKLADEYGVPAFLPNITRQRLEQLREDEMANEYLELLEKIDTDKVPTLDEIIIDTLIDLDDKKAFYRELIDGIKPGLTHLLFHAAKQGDELNAIANTHASRNADYLAFSDPALKAYIDAAGVKHIGYRELRAHL
ncbi:MAG: polysaccharide deacetylase family protein [Gammaproteobacteria bacterium]|nr:polysaccharide deacetylase family protein [Gammaproteobacteria bacterium]